jgi:L-iditol 2-dehydrogenase
MQSSPEIFAAVLNEHGQTPLKPVTLPPLQPGDARVRLLACGVCSGEAMDWYVKKKSSAILGHELVAQVLEVASPCKLKIGDHIFPHHHAPCGECEFCRKNLESNCLVWKSSHLIPGGYAEEFIVPAHQVKKDTLVLPKNLSVEAATFIEPVACCVRALEKAQVMQGDRVLILGLGIMGLLNVLVFSKKTKCPILATDFLELRRKKAQDLGAFKTLDPKQEGWQDEIKKIWNGNFADVVVVCPSSGKAILQGLSVLAPGGRLILFAPPPPDEVVNVNFNELFFKEISITSAYSAGPKNCLEALSLILSESKTFESLVSHVWPLEKLGEALKAIRDQEENVFKIIVKPSKKQGASS